MPVSKRDKKVSLTKTTKKGMELKHKVVDRVRESLDKYNNVFLFSANNMRNKPFQEVREKWKGMGRFILAKRRLMSIALGSNPETEVKKDLHKMAAFLQYGQFGMFLTNKPRDEVVQFFENFSKMDYANAGFTAPEKVELPAGPLNPTEFAPAMESHLRQLGMPTQLEKGVIMLRENFTVCTKGSHLTPQAAKILKYLEKPFIEFKLNLISFWSKDGSFEVFKGAKELKTATKTKKQTIKGKKDDLKSKEESDDDIDMDVEEDPEEQETVQPQEELPELDSVQNEKNNATPKKNKTPNQTPKQNNKTPNQTPKQVTPKQNNKTPNTAPKENKKPVSPKKQKSTPVKSEEETSQESEVKDDAQSEFDEVESLQAEPSPKPGKVNPRRSMRTPKPLKRTPEQRRMSVKKLTDPAGKKGTPKGTPKKAASTRKSRLPNMAE